MTSIQDVSAYADDLGLCGSYIWQPYVQVSDDIWVDMRNYSKIVTDDIDWDKDEPNGNDLQKCIIRWSLTNKDSDFSCSAENCFVCYFNEDTHFKIRGLPINSSIHSDFLLVSAISFNGHVVFKGYQDYLILYDMTQGSWNIYAADDLPFGSSLNVSKVKASTFSNSPVGIKEWIILDEGNQTGILTLKFTSVIKIKITNSSLL